jgi:hypothetical protein
VIKLKFEIFAFAELMKFVVKNMGVFSSGDRH